MNAGGILPLAAIVYALGIATALEAQRQGGLVGSKVWLAASVCGGVLALTSSRWGWPPPRGKRLLALICLACLGGCAADLQWETWWRQSYVLARLSPIAVKGRIEGTPGQQRIIAADICAVGAPDNCLDKPYPLALLWKTRSESAQPQAGIMWAQGTYAVPQQPGNPGEYDPLSNAIQNGVAGELLVTDWRQESAKQGWLANVRAQWEGFISRAVPGDAGVLLQGMLLGGSGDLAPATRESLQRSGLSHVTSVSGLHVALVAGFCWFLLRGRSGARGWVGVLAGVFFVLLSGSKPPAMRALVGLAVSVVAGSRGQKADPWNGLALAWLALLTQNPALLSNIGFGLSFCSVAGILAIGRPFMRMPANGGYSLHRIYCYIRNSLAVSIGAQAGAAYLTVQAFNSLPVLGPVANLAGVPLATLALVIGLCGVVFSSAAMWMQARFGLVDIGIDRLGLELLQVAGWCASAFLRLCKLIAGASWSYVEVPVLPSMAGIAWLAALCALSLRMQRNRMPFVWRKADSYELGWLAMAFMAILSCLIFLIPSMWELRITFLEVGQGDAILIQSPAGTMLVDAGGIGNGWDASRVIVPHLRRRGVRSLDLVVSTHPHADHLGGMAGVIRARQVLAVLDNGTQSASNTFRNYQEAVIASGASYRLAQAGDELKLGALLLQVLWPPGNAVKGIGNDANRGSIVLRASYGNVAVLLTSDIPSKEQVELLARKDSLQAVLWKASHQGAASSFNVDFFAAVSPQVSVVSVGPNQYGHPSPAVVESLQQQSVLCRTDKDGAIEFVTNGRQWRVRSMHGRSCRASGAAE